jgi:hypothetical protein
MAFTPNLNSSRLASILLPMREPDFRVSKGNIGLDSLSKPARMYQGLDHFYINTDRNSRTESFSFGNCHTLNLQEPGKLNCEKVMLF